MDQIDAILVNCDQELFGKSGVRGLLQRRDSEHRNEY